MAVQLSRFASTTYEEISRLDAELQALATQAFAYVRGAPTAISTPFSAIPETIRNAVRAALGAGVFPDLPMSSSLDNLDINQRKHIKHGNPRELVSRDQSCDSETENVPLRKRQKLSQRFQAAPKHKDKLQLPLDTCLAETAEQLRLSQASIDGLLKQVSELVPGIPGAIDPARPPAGRPNPARPRHATAGSKADVAVEITRQPSSAAGLAEPALPPSSLAGAPISAPVTAAPAAQSPNGTGRTRAALAPEEPPQGLNHEPQQLVQQCPTDGKPPEQQAWPAAKKRAPLWLHQMLPNRGRTLAQGQQDKRKGKNSQQQEAVLGTTPTPDPAAPHDHPRPPGGSDPSPSQATAHACVVAQRATQGTQQPSSRVSQGPTQPRSAEGDVLPNVGVGQADPKESPTQQPAIGQDDGIAATLPPPQSASSAPTQPPLPPAVVPSTGPSITPQRSDGAEGAAESAVAERLGVQNTDSTAPKPHVLQAGAVSRRQAVPPAGGAVRAGPGDSNPRTAATVDARVGSLPNAPGKAPDSTAAGPAPQLGSRRPPVACPIEPHVAGEGPANGPVVSGFTPLQRPFQLRRLPESLAQRPPAVGGAGPGPGPKKRGRQQMAADTAVMGATHKEGATGVSQSSQPQTGQGHQVPPQPQQQQEGALGQGGAQAQKKRKKRQNSLQEGQPATAAGEQLAAAGPGPTQPQPRTAPSACHDSEHPTQHLKAAAKPMASALGDKPRPEPEAIGAQDGAPAPELQQGPAVFGGSAKDSGAGRMDTPLAARLPKRATGSRAPPPAAEPCRGGVEAPDATAAAEAAAATAAFIAHKPAAPAVPLAPGGTAAAAAAAAPELGSKAAGCTMGTEAAAPVCAPADALPPTVEASAADAAAVREAAVADQMLNSAQAGAHSSDLRLASTADAQGAGAAMSSQSLSSLEPAAPTAHPLAASAAARPGSSGASATGLAEDPLAQEPTAAAGPAPAPRSVPSDDESSGQRQVSGPLSDAALTNFAMPAPAAVPPAAAASSGLAPAAAGAVPEAPRTGPAQPSPCASACEAPVPAPGSMPADVQPPAGQQNEQQQEPQQQASSGSGGVAAGALPGKAVLSEAAAKPPSRATSIDKVHGVAPPAGPAAAADAAATQPAAKAERKYKPTAPPRRHAAVRAAAPSTHAELAAAAAAFMAALHGGNGGGEAEAAAAAAAAAAAGPASSTGGGASEPLGPFAGGSDFAEWAPSRNPPTDTATSPVRGSCPGTAMQENEHERELKDSGGPVAVGARAGGEGHGLRSSQGGAFGEAARFGAGVKKAAQGGGGGGPAGGEGAALSRENSSGGAGGGGDGDGSDAGVGAGRGGSGGGEERSLSPDAEAGVEMSQVEMSQVEREEWRRRRAEIERQRAEAAAEREAARRARTAQRSAAAIRSVAVTAADAELQRRIRQRLEEHHQLASAAVAEAEAKEAVRCKIRASLQERHRKALDERDLAKLLKQLGALPRGGPLKNTEQRTKALKVAKIRFHPDKASGSLEARVYAEEVSKLLNSWDWT